MLDVWNAHVSGSKMAGSENISLTYVYSNHISFLWPPIDTKNVENPLISFVIHSFL